nr:outer membrane protein [Helicobacter ailurogastricus]
MPCNILDNLRACKKHALVCALFMTISPLKAKNLSYMSSAYQIGMVYLKPINANKPLQGASITWGYEINPKNSWLYSRYYIFLDYGNILLGQASKQANLFTYGVGGELMVSYNQNPINSWTIFFGLQLGANSWVINQKVSDLIENTWDSFKDFSFKPAYFRAMGTFGVQFRTIVTWHIVDVEVGMKVFLNPEPKSPFERNLLFFISHAWHF